MPLEKRFYQLQFTPEEAAGENLRKSFSKKTGIPLNDIGNLVVRRRSIDARRGRPRVNLKIEFFEIGTDYVPENYSLEKKDVSTGKEIVIAGCGPAGLFAAIEAIQNGLRPIIIDRGKELRERRRDLVKITRDGQVDPNSNYCFGAGGAGTFSDGKLYTRSHKRGRIAGILEALVAFGASPNILVDAHPHIGTNRLPPIIEEMISWIRDCGGDVLFNTQLEDLMIKDRTISQISCSDGISFRGMPLILATGHSARDVYRLLHGKNIALEKKGLAIGVRVEHPQILIDRIQYRCEVRGEYLPPASYSLVSQVSGRGVYSFCMCPGGVIAPCATAPGEVVTNGWSPSKRNNPLANSGVVVELSVGDLPEDIMSAIDLQVSIEQCAWELGGRNLFAPAQRMTDFLSRSSSSSLPQSSYRPGVEASNLWELFPATIGNRLKRGFEDFGKKMKGYISRDSLLVAPETRTSSPLRIPRDHETKEHIQLSGLYPCGEGAGYAGGIISAALDGVNVAKAVALRLKSMK